MAHNARTRTPAPPVPTEEFPTLTTEDVAEATGFTVRHVYNLRKEGRLPAYTVAGGRAVRFKRSDVAALFVPEAVAR